MHDTLVEVCKAASDAALPSSVDLTDQFPTPGDQGGQGSCTAWAVGYALKSHTEYYQHHIIEGQAWSLKSTKTQFSPAFIYNQINGGNDKGSSISTAFNLISKAGACSLYNMPYDDTDYTTQPNASQKDFASNFKSATKYPNSSYAEYSYKTVVGVEEVKQALNRGQGVVISISCYPDFSNTFKSPNGGISGAGSGDNNGVYDKINDDDKSRGYHAICIVGYDDNHLDAYGEKIPSFKIINSWGTDVGDSGYGYISYDIFKDERVSDNKGYIFYDPAIYGADSFYNEKVDYVKAKKDVRAYTNPEYYNGTTKTDRYEHTINKGDIVKIDSFIAASKGNPACFKTSDGLYISASKEQFEEYPVGAYNKVFFSGKKVTASSYNNSETSYIKCNSGDSIQYNNHNTLRIDYVINKSDSYNGYAGVKLSADSTVLTEGASGIGFWYMTPAGTNGSIALCLQGSVNKKLVQLPTTNGEWKYYKNTYTFNSSEISDIELYINGDENNCQTTPESGIIYVADLAVVGENSEPVIEDKTYYSYNYEIPDKSYGNVTSSVDNGKYSKGTEITVKATELKGSHYEFAGWYTNSSFSGNPISTSDNYTFELNNDITLYAKFVLEEGYHKVTVECDSQGCLSGLQTGVYAENNNYDKYVNTCSINKNYEFSGWTNGKYGELISTNPLYKFYINKDIDLYAHYRKIYYHLTVDFGPHGSSSRGETGYYTRGKSITVSAQPYDENYVFDCWKDGSGNVVSENSSYQFKIYSDTELHAQFVKKSTKHSIKLVNGENGTFSGAANRTYNDGDKASITAVPDEGYQFIGWKDCEKGILVSRYKTYSFYVTKSAEYQPVFGTDNSKKYYYLGVSQANEGGTIEDQSGYYEKNSTLSIIAYPNEGYRFVGWTNKSGEIVSTKTQLNVKMSGSRYYYANFEKIPYHTVELMYSPHGSFTGAYIREYIEGKKASITAVPEDGYQFVGWKIVGTDILVSRRQTYNFYVTEDVKYQPVFDKYNTTPYFYLGVYAANEGGSVSKVTGYHVTGDSFTVTATPDEGYRFVGWSKTKDGAIEFTDSSFPVRMSGSQYYYAHFEKLPEYTLTVAQTEV